MENRACALPESFNDSETALDGIKLIVNDKIEESAELFNKFKTSSPQMHFGACLSTLLHSITTSGGDKLSQAASEIKATMEFCRVPAMNAVDTSPDSLATVLQNKIVIADCHICLGVISSMHRNTSGYIKGAWSLRKAWNIYEKTYEQVSALNKIAQAEGDSASSKLKKQAASIPKATLERLFGSVSFGYGLFKLCVSLIPQEYRKFASFMGFRGDSELGLSSLLIASKSEDMKAPLALLVLLTFYTVVHPLMYADCDKSDHSIPVAEALLSQHEPFYCESSLIQYAKGKIQLFKRDISGAFQFFSSCYKSTAWRRDLPLPCAYEIGWCCVMALDWEQALRCFTMLRTRYYSVCYFTYLMALMHGMDGGYIDCMFLLAEVAKMTKSDSFQSYFIRKAKALTKRLATIEFLVLYTLELIYFRRTFSNCSERVLKLMLAECKKCTIPGLIGLKNFLMGGIYKNLGDSEKAMEHFRSTMKVEDLEDRHIAPYACCELSILLLKKSDTEAEGLELLRRCKHQYKGYDFEDDLRMRICVLESRVEEK